VSALAGVLELWADWVTEAYTEAGPGQVDFIVRGEGEIPFRDLLRALETGSGYEMIAGLSYRHGDGFKHNRDRPISRLEQSEILLSV
jgi:radical SAM superfamily enzyme YgiQ (UPF0313 family)